MIKSKDITPAQCEGWSNQVKNWHAGQSSEVAYTILSALMAAAPSGKEQAELSKAYNEARKDGTELKWASAALSDGLMYGNWPWIDFSA